jgi:hypothetical protein
MMCNRISVYDNEYYLATTFPPAISTDLTLVSPTQRASLAIMHVFVQCPRLICLIRSAIMAPEATGSLASAVSLMEYLWQVDLAKYVEELIADSVTVSNQPVSSQMADIMPETYNYNSIQSMILCTRYWMLLSLLCGMIETLYRWFPAEVALSLLPDLKTIRDIDANAGLNLAKSLAWAEAGSQTLPLVPLRLHTPLQISIGPWRRLIRNNTEFLATSPTLDAQTEHQISHEVDRAVRMKEWLVEQCDRIHKQWSVSSVNEQFLIEALDAMTGEKIPDWLPTKVRFEAEDGNMVIKLEYEKQNGPSQESFKLSTETTPSSQPDSNGPHHSPTTHELPDRTSTSTISKSASTAIETPETRFDIESTAPLTDMDLIFKSGRNLCQTSGWWPTAPESNTTGTTPESTSTAPKAPETSVGAETTAPLTDVDLIFKSGRNLCQTSGWWPTAREPNATELASPGPGPCMVSSWWPQTPESTTGLREGTQMPMIRRNAESDGGV